MSETNPNELDAERLKGMLHKVRSLLANAEDDTLTEFEREAFNVKAAELMARYGIDAAMLEARNPGADQVGGRKIRLHAPYVADKQHLLNAIASALRVEVVFSPVRSPEPFGHLFGYAADLDRVEILYTSLLLQAVHGVARANPPYGQNVKAFRRTWLMGFAAAVRERLTKAEAAAQAQAAAEQTGAGGGAELAVVLQDRKRLAQRAKTAAYPNTRKTARRLTGSGRDAGYGAGMQANLGTGSGRLTGRTSSRALGR